jgi:uncharacterized membrane protein HdeD (DUF308 family)
MANANGMLSRLGPDARALCQRTWWVFLIGGVAAVVFAVLSFYQPLTAWLVVAMFFAAAILVDGIINVIGSVQNREKDGWWIMLLIGVLGVLVGGYALLNPLISMAAFVYLVAFQALFLGIFLAMLGWRVRAATEREWVLYVTGGLSILFGILVFVNPAIGGVSVILMIAAWAFVTGVLRIAFAIKVKNLPQRVASRLA